MAKRKSDGQPASAGPQKGEFILRAFGAVPEEGDRMNKIDKTKRKNRVHHVHPVHIHGTKGAVPVWVGEPDRRKEVSGRDVEAFANAIRRTVRYRQDNLRDGIMLAWAFRRDARIDSNDVQRKRKAAEMWCRQRGMECEIATIDPS